MERAPERNCWQRILPRTTLEAPTVIRHCQDSTRTGRTPESCWLLDLDKQYHFPAISSAWIYFLYKYSCLRQHINGMLEVLQRIM